MGCDLTAEELPWSRRRLVRNKIILLGIAEWGVENTREKRLLVGFLHVHGFLSGVLASFENDASREMKQSDGARNMVHDAVETQLLRSCIQEGK